MGKITKGITNWLIENGAIEDRDTELYEFAIYSILITISPLLLVLIIGIGMGTVLEGAIVILPFMCIRKFSGGYHANNAGICFVSSCVILVFCMWLATHLAYSYWITITTTICVISLCMNSPIDSKHKRLDNMEKRSYKKIAIILSCIFYSIHCACGCIGLEKIANCLAVGICLTAILQLPCLYQFHSESGKGTV